MLSNFVAAGDYQGALDYFGFEGTYVDEDGLSSFNPKYGIRYRRSSFESFETLYSSYLKELFHERRYNNNNRDLGNSGESSVDRWPEERKGAIYQYKNSGLHRDKADYLKIIRNSESWINSYNQWGIYNPPYQYQPYTPPWWRFIYKIPREW